jgi:hypothetical protein
VSAAKREAQRRLFWRFGVPQQIRPDVVDEDGTAVVRVYRVAGKAAADAYVEAERVLWGNPARAELRESVGWCVVVDLRAFVAAQKIAHPLPRIRG